MKLFYLLSVFIYSASVMGMPKKISLTPLSSEEDFGTLRGGTFQNIASMNDPYPIYVIAPYHSDERQKPSLNALRGLNIYDLPYIYRKKFVDKKSLDSIGGGHII